MIKDFSIRWAELGGLGIIILHKKWVASRKVMDASNKVTCLSLSWERGTKKNMINIVNNSVNVIISCLVFPGGKIKIKIVGKSN